jgi:hypothetical protein
MPIISGPPMYPNFGSTTSLSRLNFLEEVHYSSQGKEAEDVHFRNPNSSLRTGGY